ncbi:MAG: Rrf2 family transcriptional regulator [Rhodoferax sp.]|jgi:Rrf2 family iron-sulfur cluster assembly transcriptional regulator|nr:Rrf2 family transcriptional regulator [Rhodoferax sp.]
MRLSTKGRFAVTAMIEVALYERQGPVPLSDIAARQQISLSYLEQMFSKLRQHGLVESTRGPGGGYCLGQSAGSITVADIIRAVDGKRAGDGRGDTAQDAIVGKDMTQDLWDALNSRIVDYMQSITLQKLVSDQRSKGVEVQERRPTKPGVFKKPQSEALHAKVPNSVFALGQALLARS